METNGHAVDRQHTNSLFNDNKLKLGLFGINCDHGCAMTLSDEALDLSWAATREIAVTADRAGLEALVPVARWKGIGENEFNGRNFDTYTWAAGLAEATEQITLVTTSHVQGMHPVTAAKAVSTIDHISGGRSSLNVVTGWFQPEFEMFGIEFLEHDKRYAYATEWLEIIKQLWMNEDEFEFHGDFFDINAAYSQPKPLQKPYPALMNAGGSDAGRAFIAESCDIGYMTIVDHNDLEVTRKDVEARKELAAKNGRDVQLWTYAYVVQRDTMEEAEEYLRLVTGELGDESAGEATCYYFGVNNEVMSPEAWKTFMVHLKGGYGGYSLVGTADHIAERLAGLSEIGIDGVAVSWVDYMDGLRRFTADVMPMLERGGLRKPLSPVQAAAA